MKLIYITSKGYPASTADHIYVRELARGFANELKENFLLVVANDRGDDLARIPHRAFPFAFKRLRTLQYAFALPRFMKEELLIGGDTVFFSNDPYLLIVLGVLRRLFGYRYRIVSDWHMLFGRMRTRLATRASDHAITTSRRLKAKLIEMTDTCEDRISVVYGGTALRDPIGKKEARKALNLPEDRFIVAYGGFFTTMGMEKGIGLMVRALAELPSDISMLFVGGKKEEISRYTKEACSLGVLNRCFFYERQSQEELFRFECAADVLAIPYPDEPHFRDYGFPMKIYEYLMAGRPLIYSNLGIIEEAATGYGESFIAGDANDFARVVAALRDDKEKADALGAAARTNAVQNTWESKAFRILETIRDDYFQFPKAYILQNMSEGSYEADTLITTVRERGQEAILDIGCGKVKRGTIGLDYIAGPHVDIVSDLDRGLPFSDESLDGIIMYHSLEHVVDPVHLLEECHRTLKTGGTLDIKVPHHSNVSAYQVHHNTYWNSYSLDPIITEGAKSNEQKMLFRVVKKELNLVKFRFLNSFFSKRLFIYETYLYRVFPCYEIRFLLEK